MTSDARRWCNSDCGAWGDGPSRPGGDADGPTRGVCPPELAECAYDDMPLPIGEGQTISQPSIVALMTAALRPSPTDRVLEIGTGSGYAAAILHCLVQEVYTVERLEKLYRLARRRLRRLGYHHVTVHHGNGTLGWPAHALRQHRGHGWRTNDPHGVAGATGAWRTSGDAGGRPTHAAEARARDTRQCHQFSAGGAGLCMLCATDWRAGWADDTAAQQSRKYTLPRWPRPATQERHHEPTTPPRPTTP